MSVLFTIPISCFFLIDYVWGASKVARFVRNLKYYLIKPRYAFSSVTFQEAGAFWRASTVQ